MNTKLSTILALFIGCTTAEKDSAPLINGSPTSDTACEYGQENNCPENQFCINIEADQAICKPHATDSKPIGFPFGPNTEVWCDQGDLTPQGNSHTWLNTAFALDLHSKRPLQPNIPIIAVFSGKVIAHSGCRPNDNQCGLGFGNQVKILNDDGRMAFYAHLDTVNVETGTIVNKGDLLGSEGMTGLTGIDNPHLHFSMHKDWRSADFEYWKQVGYLPASIPFKLRYCLDDCSSDCQVIEKDSRDIPCRRQASSIKSMCLASGT